MCNLSIAPQNKPSSSWTSVTDCRINRLAMQHENYGRLLVKVTSQTLFGCRCPTTYLPKCITMAEGTCAQSNLDCILMQSPSSPSLHHLFANILNCFQEPSILLRQRVNPMQFERWIGERRGIDRAHCSVLRQVASEVSSDEFRCAQRR
jgi:hypothetical protein